MTQGGGRTALRSPLTDFQVGNVPMVDRAAESLSATLRLNPATSLSMTYLRAYIDWAHTQRNHVRKRRKAEHQLRMHTAHCTGRHAA
jgi:hypothetical protein